MRTKTFLLYATIAIFPVFAQAQSEDIGTGLKSKLFTGGGIGLQFGNETNIETSPVFGYHISNIFSVGLGGTYQYYNSKYYSYSLNIYGGRIFARAHLFKPVFVHAEYELLKYRTNVFDPLHHYENILSENLLAGVGYREYLSERVSATLVLLYNFNQTIYTPYANPVFRAGIEWSFPGNNR